MIINLQLLRSAFFFLGELCLSKNGDPVDVDISNKDDGFIKSIALSIRSGVLNTDADISDIVKNIKDLPSRIELQRILGLAEDVIEVVADSVEVISDLFDGDEETETETEEEKQQEKDISSLLSGPIKQVVLKIKEANLSDEEKIELISIEEANKNRSIVIAAINEA
ncbi:hypothetical protein [uncultured Flavobacterium sp.]|uniref:hypothetical protein n=1 Tax=uncultured Flavobacterium sp. TaxID=165435 RepID=UPI0025916693|nr:hypothetical protein [uncultured Flavobacterium sp.]